MSENDLHRGARIGTRIAMIVSQALVHTHTKLLDFKHKLAVMVFNTISNEISDEVDMTIGPILKRMARDYDENGHAAALMNFMAHGRGQFKAIAGVNSTAQSLLWALGTIISNELAPMSYNVVESNPNLIPDPATLAMFAATHHIGDDEALYRIRENGYSNEWGVAWIESQRQYPSPVDLADMVRKGIIDTTTYDIWASKQGYTPEVSTAMFRASDQEPSMQDAALAFLRGAITRQELDSIGQKSGYLPDSIDVYLQTIGEPPGTMDLLEGFRRGFIDQGTLQRGIKQSRTRDEWIPFIEKLRYSPMSTSDAVTAVVQGHLPYEEGKSLADQNGLEPGQFDVLYQTAGAPLSRTEVNELYNRGLVGSDVVIQALRESRLKDKYVQDAFALRQRLLEPRSLGEAVNSGAMTHDVAIHKAMESGYNQEDATYLVNAAANRKMQSYRERVISEAEKLYTDGGMTDQQFTQVVTSMGHTEAEAQMIRQSAEYNREQRAFNTATNAIRSRFVARHIDRNTASAKLDGIGMASTQRDYLLRLWELEASVNTKVLTEAQVIRAIKIGTLTPDQGAERLVAMGYSGDDAALLIADI